MSAGGPGTDVAAQSHPGALPMGLAVEWLGVVPYREALALQERRIEARRRGEVPDALLLLEHPPVITIGRSGREENVLAAPERLAADAIEVHRVSRGGDVTYHGPGQLVGYLIADLAARGQPDARAWLRRIESFLIAALGSLGLEGYTRPGQTGVFVAPDAPGPARKVASVGVGLRGWISWHGFALNVTLDPAEFARIVPCGLRDVVMTSVARELGAAVPADLGMRARTAVAGHCAAAFRPSPPAPARGEGTR